MRAEHRFDPVPRTVGDARRFVRSTLDAWCVPDGDAPLLVSELATNAILHARSAYTVIVCADGDVPARLPASPGRIRIEVTDDDPTPPRTGLPLSSEAVGGRGMALVTGLALDWGFDPLPTGKRVWFEL